jgi:hypothetical protein
MLFETEPMATTRSILFPVDFSPSCVAMAPFVKRAASIFSAKITPVYVLQSSTSSFELLVRPLPEVEENRIVIGPIKDALTEAARSLGADALVIGRSPQPGALGWLRDLTYAVVRDAPCPVLSV